MGKKTGSGTAEGTRKESNQETVQLRRRERKGHRAYLKYVGAELKGLLEPYREEQRAKVIQLKSTLTELLHVTKELDGEILRLLVEIEEVSDEEIAEEIKCAGDLTALVASANEALGGQTSQPQISPQEHSSNGSNNSASVQVRLPKLEAKRFAGQVEEWQEFWDSFQSSIHSNPKLSPVDKFSYLRGLLRGTARTAISGLALTEAAIDLLKRNHRNQSFCPEITG